MSIVRKVKLKRPAKMRTRFTQLVGATNDGHLNIGVVEVKETRHALFSQREIMSVKLDMSNPDVHTALGKLGWATKAQVGIDRSANWRALEKAVRIYRAAVVSAMPRQQLMNLANVAAFAMDLVDEDATPPSERKNSDDEEFPDYNDE